MEEKIIVILVLIGISFPSFSQKTTFFQSNQETYQKYLTGDWKGLIKAGKKAKRAGLDYYLLNVRMGAAYYYLKKYFSAITYLQKAYKQNPNDAFVKDLLFYSYLFTGNTYRSYEIFEELPPDLKEKKLISSTNTLSLDYNFSSFVNLDYNTLKSIDYKPSANSEIDLKISKNFYQFAVGVNKKLSWNKYYYQRFNVRYLNFLNIQENDNSFTGTLSNVEFRYYGKFTFLFNNNWHASFNYNVIFGLLESVEYIIGNRRHSGGYSKVLLPSINTSLGGSIAKQWHNLFFEPKFNFFFFEGINPYIGINTIYYPLSNTDLYLLTDLSYNPLTLNRTDIIIKSELGIRLSKFYITGTYYYGEMDKFLENNGLFVYNFNEKVKNQYALTITILGKKNIYYLAFVPAVYEFSYTDNSTNKEYSQSYNSILLKFGIKFDKIN